METVNQDGISTKLYQVVPTQSLTSFVYKCSICGEEFLSQLGGHCRVIEHLKEHGINIYWSETLGRLVTIPK